MKTGIEKRSLLKDDEYVSFYYEIDNSVYYKDQKVTDIIFDSGWYSVTPDEAIERYQKANVVYGLDVAEEGVDKTVLVKIAGNIVVNIEVIQESDPFEIAKVVATEMKRNKGSAIAVDIILLIHLRKLMNSWTIY